MQPRFARRRRRLPGLFAAIVGIPLTIVLASGVLIGTRMVLDATGAAITGGLDQLQASPGARPTPRQRAAVASPDPIPSEQVAASTSRPDPTPTPKPRRTPKPTPQLHPRPAAGPFAIDLYRRGDFVSELKPIWCVAAAMQVMINIMDKDRPDTSTATQERLWHLARKYSTDRLDGPGAEPEGWAGALEKLGYGPYEVRIGDTRKGTIHLAARALRMTGRPVGLVTWRGAHSWVMSGFRATADPAWTSDFEVTGIYIEDVWYPRISSIWGSSDPPGAFDAMDHLAVDFLPFRRPDMSYPDRDGKFVIILPVLPEARR